MNMYLESRQRGAALLTVLFIFMIGSLLVMAMLSRQRLDVERTGTLLAQAQAYQYALGAETLARQVLAEDAALLSGVDYLGQRWARLAEGVPVDNGTLAFSLEDLQGRFNLNTLLSSDAAKERFRRLVHLLQLPDDVTAAVIAALGTPQSPHFFTDMADLRTAQGLNREELTILFPYISILPEQESMLNVNTASPFVLQSYMPNEKAYARLADIRTNKGFLSAPQLNAIGANTKGMSVESHYFLLHAIAQVNGRSLTLYSIIYRQTDIMGGIHLRTLSRHVSGAF